MVLGNLDSHMSKNELGPLPCTIFPILTQTEDLNVRAKLLKLLEENIGLNLCDLGPDSSFFDIMPKGLSNKKTKN